MYEYYPRLDKWIKVTRPWTVIVNKRKRDYKHDKRLIDQDLNLPNFLHINPFLEVEIL